MIPSAYYSSQKLVAFTVESGTLAAFLRTVCLQKLSPMHYIGAAG